MTIQDIMAYRARVAALPEKRKKLLALARAISNNMGFAIQNAGRSAEDRYQQKADDALRELETMLIEERDL